MKRITAALILAMGLMLLIAFLGPNGYKSAVVFWHYRQILYRKGSPDDHYRAIARYPEHAYRLAARKLESAQEHPVVSVEILRQMGDTRSVELICRTLERGVEPPWCAYSLRVIGTRQAREALSGALDNANPEVRRFAYNSYLPLVAHDAGRVADTCRKGMNDRAIAVRIEVLRCLEGLPPEVRSALKADLVALFESKSGGKLKQLATELLAKDCYGPAVDVVIRDIEGKLREGDPAIVRDDLRLVGRGCRKSIVPRLLKLARECPKDKAWAVLETISDIAGRNYNNYFKNVSEAEEWWSRANTTE